MADTHGAAPPPLPWFDTCGVVLSAGSGICQEGYKLMAFDFALHGAGIKGFRGARISEFNLLGVSSIVPPEVPVWRMKDDADSIDAAGLMMPTVYVKRATTKAKAISVGVGVGIPADRSRPGLIVIAKGRSEAQVSADLEKMI